MNILARITLALGTVVIASLCEAGMYKCVKNGQITYKDKPCPEQQQEEISRISRSKDARAIDTTPIDFGKSPEAKFIKAKAIIESIEVDGRDCEWALKVDKKQLHKCKTFLSQMVEGAEWEQVNKVIQELSKDSKFINDHKVEFILLSKKIERISSYSQFAQIRLLGTR